MLAAWDVNTAPDSRRPEVRLALAAELLAAVADVYTGPVAEAIERARVAVEEARNDWPHRRTTDISDG